MASTQKQCKYRLQEYAYSKTRWQKQLPVIADRPFIVTTVANSEATLNIECNEKRISEKYRLHKCSVSVLKEFKYLAECFNEAQQSATKLGEIEYFAYTKGGKIRKDLKCDQKFFSMGNAVAKKMCFRGSQKVLESSDRTNVQRLKNTLISVVCYIV